MTTVPTRFYVATRFSNKTGHGQIAEKLRGLGHQLTFDWTAQPVAPLHDGILRAIAIHEVEGILAADYVVALLPGGLGTHTEIGVALGAEKPIILVAGHPKSLNDLSGLPFPFYRHPLVHRVNDMEGAQRKAEELMS